MFLNYMHVLFLNSVIKIIYFLPTLEDRNLALLPFPPASTLLSSSLHAPSLVRAPFSSVPLVAATSVTV